MSQLYAVEINGKIFSVTKEVFELLKCTSLERDQYRRISNNIAVTEKLPLLWVDRREREPVFNDVYIVYGTINKGSEHEEDCQFKARWSGSQSGFTDIYGEDFTGVNEGVKFWFDHKNIPCPI